MDEISALEAASDLELGDVFLTLKEENKDRVVDDNGHTFFDCLAVTIRSLLLRIQTQTNPRTTGETTIENFTNADFIRTSVVDLLSKKDKLFKSVLVLLVDDVPETALSSDQSETEGHMDTFYDSVIQDCKSDKNTSYMKLCIYATATCINTPIYILCTNETEGMQWTYFKPLLKYEGQPVAVINYVTMFMASDNTFHTIESHGRATPRPTARGLVGMYLSLLEDMPETSIDIPEELRNLPIAAKSTLCNTLNHDMVMKCCELLKKERGLNDEDYQRMTAHRATRNEFSMFFTNSPDAFDIVCQVLLKRREKTILAQYVNSWSAFVKSCDFLKKFDALMELDNAIYKRNVGVTAFVNSCIAGGQELDERRKNINTAVIASSSVGIASGGMVIAGLILAPFSLGTSLGLSIAGGVIGVGTGVAAGTARTVEAVKQNSKLKDIKEEQKEMQLKEQRVAEALQNVEKNFSTKVGNSNTSENEGPGISRRGFLAAGSALRASHSVAGIAIAAARLGATAATVTASVLGPLSLVFDVAFLAEAAHNKRSGDKTNAGELLQQMADTVDIKCKIFNSMFRGDCKEEERLFDWS